MRKKEKTARREGGVTKCIQVASAYSWKNAPQEHCDTAISRRKREG